MSQYYPQKFVASPAEVSVRSETYRHLNREWLTEFVQLCDEYNELKKILVVGKLYMLICNQQSIPYGNDNLKMCLEEIQKYKPVHSL